MAGAGVGIGRSRVRLLLASSSVVALLIGGGAPPAFATCTGTAVPTSGVTNFGTVSGYCISNETVTGAVINEGTISPSGITFTNGTLHGKLSDTGIIAGGIKLDSASNITSGTNAVEFFG